MLVERDSHLLELARYVVLNPVCARLVATAADRRWSSHRATAGLARRPPWLAADWLLARFAPRRGEAQVAHRHFVAEGAGPAWDGLRGRIYLGTAGWAEAMKARIADPGLPSDVPRARRLPGPPPLARPAAAHPTATPRSAPPTRRAATRCAPSRGTSGSTRARSAARSAGSRPPRTGRTVRECKT